jgi:hypothetical protein
MLSSLESSQPFQEPLGVVAQILTMTTQKRARLPCYEDQVVLGHRLLVCVDQVVKLRAFVVGVELGDLREDAQRFERAAQIFVFAELPT